MLETIVIVLIGATLLGCWIGCIVLAILGLYAQVKQVGWGTNTVDLHDHWLK